MSTATSRPGRPHLEQDHSGPKPPTSLRLALALKGGVSLAVWRLVEESVLVAWVSSVLTGELPEGGEKADWMKGDAQGEGLEAEDEPRKLPLAVRPLRTVVRESENTI